jgi:probable rRNA maturation factor
MPSEQPEILVANRQSFPVDIGTLTRLAQATLRDEGVDRGELSVSFVGVDEIAELHERYMGEPGPTDVLSFPMDETDPGSSPGGDQPRLIGDVVICPEYAAQSGIDLPTEIRLLLVHGILHLLGYDHDEDADRAEMWARQEHHSGVEVPLTAEEAG